MFQLEHGRTHKAAVGSQGKGSDLLLIVERRGRDLCWNQNIRCLHMLQSTQIGMYPTLPSLEGVLRVMGRSNLIDEGKLGD
mmetsp:Transcript_20877/g.52384  ORF Transcript_20877/g.52384 Transcript_20877/m.52384 type:complete len:81 (-) Transcript_20877:91-333(-)